MNSSPFSRSDFLRFIAGAAFAAMFALIVLQELLGAVTTWLVIHLARGMADGHVEAGDFVWIIVVQTLSYAAGAVSWIYAERAGFAAFGKYLLHFARCNRFRNTLLADTAAREQTEPFLTNETFRVCFDLMYDLQFYSRLFFNLVFNAIVFGLEIDAGLPVAYGFAFLLLVGLQWTLRKPLASAYMHNQRMTNRMMARTYNAWDNVFAGNRYNFGLWHADFRQRLAGALSAQIRAIMAREGWSAVSGVIALVVVLSAAAGVAVQGAGDAGLMIALAATLPRQIEMTLDMHQLTAGMTDLLAIWTRLKGICEHMQPEPATDHTQRIGFGSLHMRESGRSRVCESLAGAVSATLSSTVGIVSVRGDNGAGKSSLLATLKCQFRGRAYYLPAHDRMSYRFNTTPEEASNAAMGESEEEADEPEAMIAEEQARESSGYSSGERQLAILEEIVAHTDAPIYLLDEWDANLDVANRERATRLVEKLAQRARVVEISHRDPA